MKTTINFDMDGTIANLYGVNNWLEKLIAENPAPYEEAKPLLNLSYLARLLNKAQKNGYNLAVISWLSKNSTEAYDSKVIEAKKNWLKKHLPSVHWNAINILPYGTPKENYSNNANDILFDDEKPNREHWNGKAYNEKEIFEVLRKI